MAETPVETVNRVFRENKRYTDDGLPNPPTGAPLPVGDPASGPWNPKKADMRQALLAPLSELDGAVVEATEQAGYAEEWAQSPDPISVEAGGDGTTDHSSKWHADRAQTIADDIANAEGEFTGRALIYPDTGPEVYDAGSRKIGGLADATEDDEAVNLGQLAPYVRSDEAQAFDITEQAQARENIGVGHAHVAQLLSPMRKITNYDFRAHKAFLVADVLPSGRIVIVYREGVDHASVGGIVRTIYSDDGLEWSAPITVYDGGGSRDQRPGGGGVTASGLFVVAFEDTTLTSSDNSFRIYSSPNGEDWTEVHANALSSARIAPFGRIVNRPNGSAYITSYIGSSSGTNFDGYIIDSDDDFETFTFTQIYDNSVSAVGNFTEPSAVAISDTFHALLARQENEASDAPLLGLSTNAGLNYNITTVSSLVFGRNPPILWYDEEEDLLYAFWMIRSLTHVTAGNLAKVTPGAWYFSTVGGAELIAGTGSFRPQIALPIFGPLRGSGAGLGGDQAYQRIVKSNGMVYMVHYAGASDDFGCDLYMTNLTHLLGMT